MEPDVSEVVPGLFLGPALDKHQWRGLRNRGVDVVVSLQAETVDNAETMALEGYLWLPTCDGEAPTLEQLRMGVQFIASALAADKKVYVHCLAGVGRSPTFCAAYLVYNGHSLEEALQRVRQTHPSTMLNETQLRALRHFEAEK